MKRRSLFFLAAAAACKRASGRPVRIATQSASIAQMPAAFTQTLGYYREESIAVELQHFPSSGKALESWNAGSSDILTGPFEFALRMTAQARPLASFVQITSSDGRGILAAPGRTDIRSVADLRGKKIGITGFGSGTHDFARYVLARHGIRDDEVSFIPVGTGPSALLAVERGMVDAASSASAEFFRLQMKFPHIAVLVNVATREGSKAFWGSDNVPFIAMLAAPRWLLENAPQARGVARAVKKTVLWMRGHTPEQILEQMTPDYTTSDRAGDLETLRMTQIQLSPDCLMPPGGAEIIHRAVAGIQENIRAAKINLAATYTNEFVKEPL